MNILIAPNALKGSLPARKAAEVIARGLPQQWAKSLCPVADGGNGTVDCLVAGTGGKSFETVVAGPFASQQVTARWGCLGTGNAAVIEMAEAAGLHVLRPSAYSPSHTTTFGVGQLILAALDAGFRTIYVGLGGSATNDGGMGCLQALGARFLDRDAKELPAGGIHLGTVDSIDISSLDGRVAESTIVCLADVQNSLVGPTGASVVYGPQKGATNDEALRLDAALTHYAAKVTQQSGIRLEQIPGGGAAGGLGAGLHAFCRATIVPGIDRILDLIGFDEYLRDCDVVITAEGRIDSQTVQGKGVAGIARRAKKCRKTVHVFTGGVRGDIDELRRQLDVDFIHPLAPASMPETDAMLRVEELLESSVRAAARGFA